MDFKITSCRGFHFTFPNGYTISVQFGGGNYSTNYSMKIGSEPRCHLLEANQVETAYWGPDGAFVDEDGNSVQGYQTAAQVWERMQRIAALPKKEANK